MNMRKYDEADSFGDSISKEDDGLCHGFMAQGIGEQTHQPEHYDFGRA